MITRAGMLDESVIDHILAGGGFMGAGSRARPLPDNVTELTFQIDLIVFADGEIAGPDPDDFAAELQVRKSAAEFIAKHIRQAEAEDQNVASALAEFSQIPMNHKDPLARMLHDQAETYMRRVRLPVGRDMSTTALRFLETRPDLPSFYRR
jgi:hypothetical protein